MKSRLLFLFVSACLLIGLLPVRAAGPVRSATIFFSVSSRGALAFAKDGSLMARRPLTVTDLDADGVLTVDEALVAAHARYHQADGYGARRVSGISVYRLWGVNTSNVLFFINNTGLKTGVGTDEIHDGDELLASINSDDVYYSDWYSYFDTTVAEVEAGQAHELCLTGYYGMAYTAAQLQPTALSGIRLGYWQDGSYTALNTYTDKTGHATLCFDRPGVYYLSAMGTFRAQIKDYATGKTLYYNCPLIAPLCVLNVYGTDDSVRLRGVSISLESDIAMNFYVPDSQLTGWSEPYVVFSKQCYNPDGERIEDYVEAVHVFERRRAADGTPCHVFVFPSIAAKEMTSTVKATLYASKNGAVYRGGTMEQSVQQYASRMLSLSATTASLKTLLVDMLNYGAQAQLYFQYHTAALANSALSAAQCALATQQVPGMSSATSITRNADATVGFKTATLLLEERVCINYYLNLYRYEGEPEDLYAQIRWIGPSGESCRIEIDDFLYKQYNGAYYYVINFDALSARQLRTVCTVELFSRQSGACVSDTLCYSVESYCASKLTNAALRPLVIAMMQYGDSTQRYFDA